MKARVVGVGKAHPSTEFYTLCHKGELCGWDVTLAKTLDYHEGIVEVDCWWRRWGRHTAFDGQRRELIEWPIVTASPWGPVVIDGNHRLLEARGRGMPFLRCRIVGDCRLTDDEATTVFGGGRVKRVVAPHVGRCLGDLGVVL